MSVWCRRLDCANKGLACQLQTILRLDSQIRLAFHCSTIAVFKNTTWESTNPLPSPHTCTCITPPSTVQIQSGSLLSNPAGCATLTHRVHVCTGPTTTVHQLVLAQYTPLILLIVKVQIWVTIHRQNHLYNTYDIPACTILVQLQTPAHPQSMKSLQFGWSRHNRDAFVPQGPPDSCLLTLYLPAHNHLSKLLTC